jgi:hypothetical protein
MSPRAVTSHKENSIMSVDVRWIFGVAALLSVTLIAPHAAQAQTAQTPAAQQPKAPAKAAQQTKMKACADEWNALKAAKKTDGRKYRDFQKECLAKDAAAPAAPAAAAPAPAPAPTVAVPAPAPAKPVTPATRTQTTPTQATRANLTEGEFATEAAAKARCPTDIVVWANRDSKIYHFAGNRSYGKTKDGAFMCQADSDKAGFRAAKNEKAPKKP